MRNTSFILILIVNLNILPSKAQQQNGFLKESNEDFTKRMAWFFKAKYGMFIHFGLYSQLGGVWKGKSYKGYAEWIQANADITAQEYALLVTSFNPQKFDADFIAKTAKKAGMKYIVITSKHHDGFCLWDSKYTNFDIANTPFKRDILKELSVACRKYGLKFGTYYSIIDWHHPSQQRNSDGNTPWNWWGEIRMKLGKKKMYINYMKNQIKELIDNYDTDILWFDGDWVHWWNMENGKALYQYIRGLKPNILINNRVAKRKKFKKDFGTPEQEHPNGTLKHYWEACYTMNHSWGFKANDTLWKTPKEIYQKLRDINQKGGNLLLNTGPDGQGVIPQKSVDVLLEVGTMLKNDAKN